MKFSHHLSITLIGLGHVAAHSAPIVDAFQNLTEHLRAFSVATLALPSTNDESPKIDAILQESEVLTSFSTAIHKVTFWPGPVPAAQVEGILPAFAKLGTAIAEHVELLDALAPHALKYAFEDYVYGSITRHKYLASQLSHVLGTMTSTSNSSVLKGADFESVLVHPFQEIMDVYWPLKHACKPCCTQSAEALATTMFEASSCTPTSRVITATSLEG